MIEIKKITREDIPSIKLLADTVNIKFVKRPDHEGFLVYNPSSTIYFNRLLYSKYNFCIKNNEGLMIGFILCLSKSEILNPKIEKITKYENLLLKTVKVYEGNYIWLDQIAVLPKYRNSGLGTALLRHVCEKANEDNITTFFGSISIFPEFNLPSYQFIKRFNFNIVSTVPQITANSRIIKRVWGIFSNKKII